MDRLRNLAETRGFFTRTDALEHGYDDRVIRRLLKGRDWVRIRAGSYTFPDLWRALDDQTQHRVRAHAVAHRLGPGVALSHVSAALDHGLTVWRPDLSLVHVTRVDRGTGRTAAGVKHHEGLCLDQDLMEQHGHLVVGPVRAALETASCMTTEGGLVVLDDLLRRGHPREELDACFDLMRSWPWSRGLQIAVRLADGRAESPGESRSGYLFYSQGIPKPVLQYEVRDSSGALLGVCDFGWPEYGLLGEFDGRIKYGRLLRDGEEPGDAVFREKVREDALREATGWRMVRLVWADLERPAATAARVRRLLGTRAA